MTRLSVLTAVIVGFAIVPAIGNAAPTTGVVVARQGQLLLVAFASGRVRVLHGRARVGARVSSSGTHFTIVGLARNARLRGVLVRRSGSRIFVESAHHLLALDSGRVLSSVGGSATAPQPGDVVDAEVAIDGQGDLAEQTLETVGHDTTATVQATIAALAPGSITLVVNGKQVTLALPAGLTLPSALVGTQADVKLDFASGQATAESTDAEQTDKQGDEQSGRDADNTGGDEGSSIGSSDAQNPDGASTVGDSTTNPASGDESQTGKSSANSSESGDH
jgi:hypothetical protein